jgi:UDP-N-acetylmuramoyl-tripeptide--D-alanyl-D-alanine ligase
MEIDHLYRIFLSCSKVVTDSRKAEQNALFFALRGDNFDGNKYAEVAIEKGCSFAIIDNPDFEISDKFILVDNVLETLQSLGSYHQSKLNIPIIAITGTNGKTTTKELVAAVLSEKFNVSFTKGNLNNHIGVPLTLLDLNKKTEIGIVEMGANHLGEIKRLCEIAKPDFGLITNIGKAHLEGFGTSENIVKAKSELFEYLKLNNGKVFYNANNEILKGLVEKFNLSSIDFGDTHSAVNGKVLPTDKFLSLEVFLGDYNANINTQLIGNYNLENVLAAASIGYYMNVKAEKIISAIEQYIPTNNRSQFLKTEKNKLFLDAYNANPTSVEASVNNFISLKVDSKCVILGDMLELGIDSLKEHQKIVELLRKYFFNKVILVGDIYNSLNVDQEYLQFANVYDLRTWLSENKISESNILIKGSRGVQLEQVIDLL